MGARWGFRQNNQLVIVFVTELWGIRIHLACYITGFGAQGMNGMNDWKVTVIGTIMVITTGDRTPFKHKIN